MTEADADRPPLKPWQCLLGALAVMTILWAAHLYVVARQAGGMP